MARVHVWPIYNEQKVAIGNSCERFLESQSLFIGAPLKSNTGIMQQMSKVTGFKITLLNFRLGAFKKITLAKMKQGNLTEACS